MYNRMYKLFSDKFTNSFLIIILSIRYNLVLDKKYSTVHALISLTENIPPIFKSWFTFCSDFHNYHTVSSTADKIFKPSYRTDSYGKNSITLGAINSWNKTQHQFSDLSLKTFSPTKIKSLLFKKMHCKILMKNLKGCF